MREDSIDAKQISIEDILRDKEEENGFKQMSFSDYQKVLVKRININNDGKHIK